MLNVVAIMFSPPYGDGTMSNVTSMFSAEFSPPYGDDTNTQPDVKKVFAPLRGWYTKYITEYRKMEELNA